MKPIAYGLISIWLIFPGSRLIHAVDMYCTRGYTLQNISLTFNCMYIIWYDVVNNNHLGLQLIFTSAYVINENEWIESTETQVGSASSAVTQNSSVPEMEWRPEVQLDSRRTTDWSGANSFSLMLCQGPTNRRWAPLPKLRKEYGCFTYYS